jgi:4-amino-4-deoxy-L-arabinose transferase-like glycosyltransferase
MRATRAEYALVALVLLVGAGLRLWLLLGPYREIDADEAVVGLMALQMPGELPAFYWQQEYLGTLEPLTAWLVFGLVGPSAAALKAVPALYSLLFVGLVYVVARPAFGPGPALLAALYLAVPPSFFAAWSVKARGGYAEALALGMVCLLAAQRLGASEPGGERRGISWRAGAGRWALLFGVAAGLALWTHPMAIIFVAAGALAVTLCWRPWTVAGQGWRPFLIVVALAAVAGVAGLLPALVHNVANGFPSLRFAAAGGTEPRAALLNLWGLVRYGLPVLVGLAEGTPTQALLLQDWPTRPGSSWLVTALLPLLGLGIVWWHRRALLALLWAGQAPDSRIVEARRPALFLLVLLLVPPFVAVSRFANLWAEPRYALPIYAAVPLVTAIVWSVRRRSRALAGALATALLALNLFSLATSDYRLSLPVNAGESTAASRAVLIAALQERGIDRIYTDYWLAYPIAFESRESIIPSVWSGGFGRRAVYSHLVFVAPDPAFVFARETPGDREFRARLAAVGGAADLAEVAEYRIYTNVQPLDALRRP